MNLQHSLAIVVKAVDQMSGPFRKMNGEIGRFTKPWREAQAQIAGAFSGFAKDAGFGAVGAALGGVGTRLKGVADEARKLGGLAALGGGGLLYGFKTQFVDTAAQFEKFRTILTTLEGSSDKADKSMGWISEFAAKTPYELDQVMSAFIKMRSYGIDPMDGSLRSVGDAAAAMGKPLDQAVEALADARSAQFERLRELIGGSFETKGDKMVYTFVDKEGATRTFAAMKNDAAGLQKMVLKVFEAKGYTGAMDNLSKTWDGMLSNLGDQWTRFANMVMAAGTFDWLKAQLEGFLAMIDEMAANGELQDMAVKFGKNITDAFKGAVQFGKDLSDFMGGWKNVAIGLGVVIAGPLISSLVGLASAFVSLGVAIMTTPIGWIAAGVALLAGAGYLLWSNWSAIGDWFKGLWEDIKQSFKDGFDSVLGFIGGIDLAGAGERLVGSLWDGLAAAFEQMFGWFKGKLDSLVGLMPDGVRSFLGIEGASTGAANVASTGAGDVISGAQATKTTTEVVIRGENLPRGFAVEPASSDADRTTLDLGYAGVSP